MASPCVCVCVFFFVALGNILKSRFHLISHARCELGKLWKHIGHVVYRDAELDIDWLCVLVISMMMFLVFFFLHQTWTLKCLLSVRPFPFTAAIFCFGSLLLTRIHKLSIARFDFTYREGDVCWHIRLPVECEFFLLFGQVFMLQENRFLQQEQIMLVLPHFRFILCWRLY